MKQGNLTISFDEEKIAALRRYMGKRDLNLESALTDAATKLYEKYVPAPVREYIDETDAPAPAPATPRSKRSPKLSVPKPTEESEVVQ